MKVYFGTLDISGQGRNLEVAESGAEIDVTTYGSTDKEFLVGLTERTGTLQVLDDATASAVRVALGVGSQGSLTWFPQGTASGSPKFQVGTARVRERNISYPYDDAVSMAVTIRLSGAVTESTADGTGK